MLFRLIFFISILLGSFICTGCTLADSPSFAVFDSFGKKEEQKQDSTASSVDNIIEILDKDI